MSSVYPPFGGPPAQLCLRCGTPLPSNVVTCVNCGTYNPAAQPGIFSDQRQIQWGGLQSQASFSGGQYSGTLLGQPPASSSQYNQWGQPPALPQNNAYGIPYTPQSSPPPPTNFYPMPGQSPQSNFNNFYVAPQQNAFYSSPTTTYGGYNQSPQRKRGSKVGLIIGVVLLVVFLVGGAFTGYFYYKNHFQNSSAISVTPTIVVTPTAIPLFSDSFANNTMGWDLTSNQGKFSVKVGGGSLVLEDDQNKLLWEVVPGKIFTDFRLDVDATLTRGDPNNGYGVLIRASSQETDLATYYRFELYGDGTYAIFKGYLDASGTTQSIKVQGYIAHPAIAKVGYVNHITIVAKGPAMSLMVNGQAVYTYTDDNYRGGSVALFVSNLPELPPGAKATFTHLAIFPAPK
jgi:3-keto-disaccharide hydrolase